MTLEEQLKVISKDYTEIKETQNIQLLAQAETYELIQADITMLSLALAAIYEKIGEKNND